MAKGNLPPCEIWDVFDDAADDLGKPIGYLVAERGNPHLPVAFVAAPSPRDNAEHDKLFSLAMELVDSPHRVPDVTCVDLRGVGRLDSAVPTPAALYRWRLGRVDEGPEWAALRLAPFCKFRLARLAAQFARMSFTAEQLAECPLLVVGVSYSDGEDGGGHNYTCALPPASWAEHPVA